VIKLSSRSYSRENTRSISDFPKNGAAAKCPVKARIAHAQSRIYAGEIGEIHGA
jgi:hypothetical protein